MAVFDILAIAMNADDLAAEPRAVSYAEHDTFPVTSTRTGSTTRDDDRDHSVCELLTSFFLNGLMSSFGM